MNRYTLEELSSAAAYEGDPALATLARRVAESAVHLNLPTGERKRLALSGGMAQAVLEAISKACDAADAEASEAAADLAAMQSISLPGWTINIGNGEATFGGPKEDEAVNASLRRHGQWDGGRRLWRVPVSKGRTLARSLKRQAGPSAIASRAEKAQASRQAEVVRWLEFVESSAREGRVIHQGRVEGNFMHTLAENRTAIRYEPRSSAN